jgi:hypothetical protein
MPLIETQGPLTGGEAPEVRLKLNGDGWVVNHLI